jgi:hypothetical protein
MSQSILDQLNTLKSLMVLTADKYNYDFQHPDILKISRDIDEIVVLIMKVNKTLAK